MLTLILLMQHCFAVYRCNFKPRCALEINDAGDQRLDKINRIIKDKGGIHDISRTELESRQ